MSNTIARKRWTLLYQQGDSSQVLCATFVAEFTEVAGELEPAHTEILLHPRGHADDTLVLVLENPVGTVAVPDDYIFTSTNTALSGTFRGLIIERKYTIWVDLRYGIVDRPPLHFEGNVVAGDGVV